MVCGVVWRVGKVCMVGQGQHAAWAHMLTVLQLLSLQGPYQRVDGVHRRVGEILAMRGKLRPSSLAGHERLHVGWVRLHSLDQVFHVVRA